MASRRRTRATASTDLGTSPGGRGKPSPSSYAPPWAAWIVLAVAASLGHVALVHDPLSAVAVCLVALLLTAGLAWFTHHVFRARGGSIRWHATVSVAAAGLWLAAALAVGTPHPAVMGVWAVGGLGVCGAWSLRRLARGEGHDGHGADGDKGVLDAIGLAGARFGKATVDGPKVRVPVKLVGGEQVTTDAQKIGDRVASKFKLRRGAVRVIPNPENEAEPTLEIVVKDPLAKPTAWPGPSAFGGSIDLPVPVGVAEDGQLATLFLPGDPRQARVSAHYKVAGMSGSGKSMGGLVFAAEVITRVDASLIYVDPVKGVQTIAPIVDGVDLPILAMKAARLFMKKLPQLITDRTHWLGTRGLTQWEEGCGLKYLVVLIEESAALIADSSTFTAVSERARSAGISLLPSQQRWSHDRVDTSARENFGGGWCFGVASEDSAAMVLDDEVIDAGAKPWVWKNHYPGYFYLVGPGIPVERWHLTNRTYRPAAALLRKAAADAAAAGYVGLDHVTAMSLGELYAEHLAVVTAGTAPWQQLPGAGQATRLPAAADADDEDDDLDEELDEAELAALDEDLDMDDPLDPPPPPPTDDGEPVLQVDPEHDIPEDDDEPVIQLGDHEPRIQYGRAEAVAALEAAIADAGRAGKRHITTAELVELRQQIGRSPAWLSGELRRLVEEGRLLDDPDRGVYGLPVPIAA